MIKNLSTLFPNSGTRLRVDHQSNVNLQFSQGCLLKIVHLQNQGCSKSHGVIQIPTYVPFYQRNAEPKNKLVNTFSMQNCFSVGVLSSSIYIPSLQFYRSIHLRYSRQTTFNRGKRTKLPTNMKWDKFLAYTYMAFLSILNG